MFSLRIFVDFVFFLNIFTISVSLKDCQSSPPLFNCCFSESNLALKLLRNVLQLV